MTGRIRRRLLGLTLLALVTGWLLTHAGAALIVEHDVASPDAIVMLASHEWERLPATAALAQRHPAALVLLTVPGRVTPENCHRCSERPRLLEEQGVSSDRIVLLEGPRNTYQEADATLRFARQRGIERILVVTSPYHARRSFATFSHLFEASGIAVGVSPATRHSQAAPRRWWMTPHDRWYVRYEWSALTFYLFRYGIIPGS